jgi:hypothetical protein
VGHFDSNLCFCPRQTASATSPKYHQHNLHQHQVALHFGVYNFVHEHYTLGTTPAVAAGLEEKPWSLEQVVEMTQAYFERKGVAK